MASNRYTQLSFNSLKDVPMFQLPYEQLDQLLSQQQGKIDMTKAFAEKAPKYIQESTYATEAAKQINQYQEGIKTRLTDIAKEGNVPKYMQALSEAQQELASLYRPGGLAYNLEQDYMTYQAHVAKEQERLSKGEITPEQYQMSIKKPLSDYDILQGSKRYNPTLKPQAVKFDDFAKDFVKNYQDDKYNKGDLQIINDRVFYRNTEVSGVEAQRVLQGLSQAYKNAASGTGQLEDLFQARNQDNAIIQQYRNTSIGDATKTLDVIQSLNTKDKESVKKVQRLLNNIGLDTGGVDGDYGPKTQAALDVARNTATDILNNVPNMKDEELFDKAKDKFINSHVNQLASPYADATARRKEEIKWTDMGETRGRFAWEEDYKSKKRMEEEANKNAIVPIMPASKAVPKDVKYYAKNGELRQNTNASADALSTISKVFADNPALANNGVGVSKAIAVVSFFDRLFTKNDKADFSDPTLNNIREHMAVNVPGFWNMDESQQMEMVAKEIDRQSKESLGGNFTANTSSKLKENYDKIFGAIKYDKDGVLQYDPGLLPNFEVITREGKKVSGQKFLDEVKDGEYGKEAGISYKGTVDDWTSPLPYGTTIMGVGNTEVHVEPDVESTKRPEAWANGLWRAKQNAEIGHTSNFKYFGNDYTAIYKPDGTYKVKQQGTNNWETVQEVVDEKTGQTNFVKVKK